MNEPGMRSPAGIARGQEPAWSLVSWLAVLAAQNGVCSLPGDPGSYQALTCRSRGCDSGGLTHRCHQRLHKATRGDRHPASCNAYQVAGECDGIIRRPGRGITPPVLPWCRRCRFRLHFFLPALPFVRGLAFCWRGLPLLGGACAPAVLLRRRALRGLAPLALCASALMRTPSALWYTLTNTRIYRSILVPSVERFIFAVRPDIRVEYPVMLT